MFLLNNSETLAVMSIKLKYLNEKRFVFRVFRRPADVSCQEENIKHEKGPLQSKLFFSRNDKHNFSLVKIFVFIFLYQTHGFYLLVSTFIEKYVRARFNSL